MSKTYYKSQQWLNPIDSPSTGSVVCYDGDVQYDDGPYRSIFLEVSDCHQKARLHKSHTDSIEDFVCKLVLLRKEIDDFICHLKQQRETEYISERRNTIREGI